MKKTSIFSIIFILFWQFATAQNPNQIELTLAPGHTYTQGIAEAMQGIDTDRIPYQTLYERVVGWASLTGWHNSDTTNFSHIKQAWWDLENSQTIPGSSYEEMKQQVAVAQSSNSIPLLGIHFGFGYIDSLALQDGRMRVENNRLIDAGLASPYLSKRVHLAALTTEQVKAGTIYRIVSDASFQLHNLSDESVTGYRVQIMKPLAPTINIPANGTANISFFYPGTNWLKITTNTTKGSYVSYQKIEVSPMISVIKDTSPTSTAPEHRLLSSTIAFRGYNESSATTSHADYHIYYHFLGGNTSQSERVLKKPIVILDGFDPLDSRNYTRIYDTLLLYDNKRKRLGDELRLKGYDVVILNFPITGTKKENNKTHLNIPEISGFNNRDGGTDYIERNAFLLVKLIQELNAELQSNGSSEQLVVVGPSMGGQISRYALAYMEKKQAEGIANMNHNTRLWVSFDSPHLGANIPLALQKDLHFFGYTGGKQAARDAYEKQLHSIAARQMLIEQLNSFGYVSFEQGLNGTDPFHKRYNDSLRNNGLPNSGGWPQNLRKIALVNGSGGGIMNGVANQMFLTLRARVSNFFGLKAAEIDNRFLANPNAMGQYFRGYIRTGLGSVEESQSFQNPNSRGSIDVVPGGQFNGKDL